MERCNIYILNICKGTFFSYILKHCLNIHSTHFSKLLLLLLAFVFAIISCQARKLSGFLWIASCIDFDTPASSCSVNSA